MGDISQIMVDLGSMDPSVRGPAEQTVNGARESDLGGFLVALVKEMRDGSKPEASRQMAGVVLKNSVAFDAREEGRRNELEAKWRALHADTRTYVKQEMMQSLDSTPLVARIVSLVIANLARIEIPAGEWQDLIPQLCNAVGTANPQWMETALTALGYVCEECDGNEGLTQALAAQSMPILDAIFKGLYHESPTVRYNAVNALCNAIDFIGHHMENEEQRTSLINGICDAAAAAEVATRQKALETLVALAKLYYEQLGAHVQQLWNVTTHAIANDKEECALQGLLFWLAIAEIEVELEDVETNQSYTKAILGDLFKILADCLQKQEEGQTEEDWNVSTAASKTLVAVAEAAGDAIMDVAMPFVHANIGASAWRQREAAVLAFGCILHGPDPGLMRQVVAEAITTICGYVSDNNAMVRDSAMWTLSVMCAEFSDIVLSAQFLDGVLGVVAPTLQMDSGMTCRGAAVIHNLCLHFDDDDDDDENGPKNTNELSPYYEGMVTGLLAVLDRPDVDDHMRHDTQEALNRLFGAAAPDVYSVLIGLIPQLLQRLEQTTTMAKQHGLTPEIELSQGLLVGALNHICRKVKRQATPHLEAIANGLVAMFSCSRDGSVLVEAIMCIGALALATREAFVAYLEGFHPYVQAALTSVDDYDLCASAIATVGDLASALEAQVAPMLPETLNNYAEFLRSDGDRDLKGPMLSCLGDVALNVGGEVFQPYADTFVQIVQGMDTEARSLIAGFHTQEDEDFVAELWESMLSFGTGLVQGFGSDPSPILGHLDYFLDLSMHTTSALANDEDVLKAAITLLGDMANVMRNGPPQYRGAAKGKLCTPQVQQLVGSAMQWDDEALQESAKWSMRELQHLSNC
eukprot:CAMPEP_0174829258 /NCGR_PEP_ID=MMETSP1114-20130205/1828_1 /TAXON_ID=312471 /ORGANISM="Neobodo designis, Strain CCAP 1951/1" /LENGTH=862 /DNA_ID=CAMNT_0016063001 /DNA_START=267 /DNA_END=2855 /DNA_ORIENTATION=-